MPHFNKQFQKIWTELNAKYKMCKIAEMCNYLMLKYLVILNYSKLNAYDHNVFCSKLN